MTRKHVPVLVPAERVAKAILIIRGRKVILDADLAVLYGVPTYRLNEQVKRNTARFPEDFAFRLDVAEVEALNRSQDAIGSQKHRNPRFPPWAFTEHGALAAAERKRRIGFMDSGEGDGGPPKAASRGATGRSARARR